MRKKIKMKIAELLHFCLTAKRSGVIQLDKSGKESYIYIRDGEVVAAQHEDIQGEEAFFEILLQEDQNTEFTEKTVTEPKSISKSTHFLLMEAARLTDEASTRQTSPPINKEEGTDKFCLKFITLDNAKFALKRSSVLIGRGKNCDITVPDVSVSTKHCKIIWNGKNHLLSDGGSSNGTYLNDQIVTESQKLSPGDRIQVGLCHFCYEVIKPDDKLEDPQSVIPFTFGTETQKIELPPKHETGASKFASQTDFKEYKPVDEKQKKIHLWPFGKKS